jgi:hypothetical protein
VSKVSNGNDKGSVDLQISANDTPLRIGLLGAPGTNNSLDSRPAVEDGLKGLVFEGGTRNVPKSSQNEFGFQLGVTESVGNEPSKLVLRKANGSLLLSFNQSNWFCGGRGVG